MNRVKALLREIDWRAAAPSIILVINSFVWYILTYVLFTLIVQSPELGLIEAERLWLFVVYNLGIAFSAILGAKLFPKTRSSSLKIWLFIGAISTSFLMGFANNNIFLNTAIALFFGASIGVGLPSCLSYFADSNSIEKRGFLAGLIWSAVGFTILIFTILVSIFGSIENILFMTIWRLSGGLLFYFADRNTMIIKGKDSPSYLDLIRRREILLYLLPWLLFSIINFAAGPIVIEYFEGIPIMEYFGENPALVVQLIEMVFVGVFAVLGGFIADIIGRKRVVIIGFVMIGIEYAVMSAVPSSDLVLYLFITLDGLTWGMLFSIFLTVIWGDLGEHYAKEKFYVLGGLPFLLANFLPIVVKPLVPSLFQFPVFSIASFFLFLAVLPLMYAQETLPEKKIREREIQFYVEKAQAIKQKYS